MADNITLDPGEAGSSVVTAEITWSGDTAHVQGQFPGIISGSAESYVFTLIVGGAGAVTGGVQRVTLASDDPAVALLTTIDVDTSKIPSLGTAAMVAAAPVTIATDDTQFGAVGAAADVDGNVHGQLRYIGAALAGTLTVGTHAVTQSGTWNTATVTNLAQLGGQAIAMNTGVRSAGTQRVTIATNDIVPVSQSGTWNITNVSGTISLPTGAATSAKQPALGTGVMVGSAPMTLATDDTQFGAVGAGSDVDGNAHGQLRYIGENAHATNTLLELTDATTDWIASADAATIAQESDHIPSHSAATSLSFAKTGTSTTEASYGKTISAINTSLHAGNAVASFNVRHGNYTNVAQVFIRIGTNSTNYMEYAIDPSEFSTTLWTEVDIALHEGIQTGTGLDLSAVTYVAFGVTMGASGNTISDVFFSVLEIHSVNASELTVQSDVTASTVRVSKMGANSNQNVAMGTGADTTGVQRISLATNVALPAGTNTVGGTISQASSSVVYDGTTACTVKRFSVVVAADDATVIAAATGTKKIRVLSMSIIALSATASNIYLETKVGNTAALATTANRIPIAVDADGNDHGGLVLNWNPGGWFETANTDDILAVRMSSAQAMLFVGNYIEVA